MSKETITMAAAVDLIKQLIDGMQESSKECNNGIIL